MDLMTIGAFAERTRLSAKALRLYDRLGLVPPARTDPVSGYRFYSEDQVAGARLVALLRRLGMPLPVIADVVGEAARRGGGGGRRATGRRSRPRPPSGGSWSPTSRQDSQGGDMAEI